MGDELQVILARLEGRVESLTQVVELRMKTQERDLEGWKLEGDVEHRRLVAQIEQSSKSIHELQEFKSKVIGIGIGLSLASGTVSGILVSILTNAG